MSLCPKHHLPLDENLECCWRCVAAERDPSDRIRPCSWWWHLPCTCAQPTVSWNSDYCTSCRHILPVNHGMCYSPTSTTKDTVCSYEEKTAWQRKHWP